MVNQLIAIALALPFPSKIFSDGFESGGLAAWSHVEAPALTCPWLPSADPAICGDPDCYCQWVYGKYEDGTPCANLVALCFFPPPAP